MLCGMEVHIEKSLARKPRSGVMGRKETEKRMMVKWREAGPWAGARLHS